jgi:hypothetical protein
MQAVTRTGCDRLLAPAKSQATCAPETLVNHACGFYDTVSRTGYVTEYLDCTTILQEMQQKQQYNHTNKDNKDGTSQT